MSKSFDASDMAKDQSVSGKNPTPAQIDRFARIGIEGANAPERELMKQQNRNVSGVNRTAPDFVPGRPDTATS